MIRRPPRSTLFPYPTLYRSATGVPQPPLGLLDIAGTRLGKRVAAVGERVQYEVGDALARGEFDARLDVRPARVDRKSTRLNSSHANISYAVFCLKKKH